MRIDKLKGSSYHQTGGPLTVEDFRYRMPVTDYVLNATTQMGYEILDVNGAKQTGFMRTSGTLRDGLRCSTAKAFIRPASKRKNLQVSLLSMAEKILIRQEGNTRRAYGVQFRVNGMLKEVNANREVILSAGSIQSPQLLMLSGIGPRDHLEEMGVPLVLDSPGVGQNLMDHISMGGLTYLVDPPQEYTSSRPFTFVLPRTVTPETTLEFAMNHTGPLYSAASVEGTGFVNSR
ncbi:glucose dehydrogenase [FAD, quinone]-like [Hylaeus volcanicus]|uniref:glucose dehydrogenase [FAD, quinone]-like n=1 Tax=Hylaeus volcanicus TaxID=313075 RepID=UPI0023B7C995|nr:glucose dehydrogenase [FAD, quinone]-like [Hylaeus volcanicus]